MDDQADEQTSNEIDSTERMVLEPGTHLEPSGVYLDLNDLQRGPFKALPGQQAGSGNRYVARRDVDQTTWNRLVEQTPSDLNLDA